MAKNFGERVQAGQANVTVLNISDAKAAIDAADNALIIDVRDGGDLAATGVIPGTTHISLGSLFYKADQTMPEGVRDARLGDGGARAARPEVGRRALAAAAEQRAAIDAHPTVTRGELFWQARSIRAAATPTRTAVRARSRAPTSRWRGLGRRC